MLRLVLDTALEYSYLGILKDDEIIYESYEKGSNNHSETLLPKLESALKENSITLKDIEEVYTGIGPGSYTGVRIAVVISKMIYAMNNIKLYSFSSLASLASSRNGESYVLVDCRRGNAFVAHFIVNDNISRLEEDKVVVISDYFKDIDESLIIKEAKMDPVKLIHSSEAKLVEDGNSLSPNYIQLVEAERIKLGLK